MRKSREDKKKRAEIFKDTTAFFKENQFLANSIKESKKGTKFYDSDEYPTLQDQNKDCKITFSGERTFESALRLLNENPEKRVAVLNFASAVNPGGGVVHGSGAQEECLCRTSTLYSLLNTAELKCVYYSLNKEAEDNLHTDAVIYTPGVIICKTDTDFPERLPESEFKAVDVLTCAAPNLNPKHTKKYSGDNPIEFEVSFDDQYKLHYKRCEHILAVAADNRIDILVLGAFGCGAFCNDPRAVATAMTDACKQYSKYFDNINFAVVKKKKINENYRVFEEVITSIN